MDMQLTIDNMEIPAQTVNVPKISLGRWHLAVLDRLDVMGDASDEELIAQLNKSGNTIRPRRLELARHFYIEKGIRTKTPSGRLAQRWHITERGRKALDEARLP
jgi:hypothetical protein